MSLLPKLPRLGLQKRGNRADRGAVEQADARDREEALKMARARVTGEITPPVSPPTVKPAAPPANQPLPVATPDLSSPPEAQPASVDPLKAMSEAATAPETDLLDIFIEAKSETDEGSLAALLDEVSISDLLGEVLQVGRRLGVHAPAPRPSGSAVTHIPPASEGGPESLVGGDTPPESPDERVDQQHADCADTEAPDTAALGREDEPDQHIEHEPELHIIPAGPDPEDQPPAPAEGPEEIMPPVRRIEAQDPTMKLDGSRERHGRYLAAIAAFGVGLAVMTSYGISQATEAGQPREDAVAELSVMSVPDEHEVGTASVLGFEPEPVPVASPSAPQVAAAPALAVPSEPIFPVLRPAPQVGTFDRDWPAFIRYTIQSGDSLTSIANEYQICPDHIIWNNNGSARLRAGDEILLPGYPGMLHQMQKGENLGDVARRFNTDSARVLAYPGNQIRSAADATAGKLILLPGGFPASALEETPEGTAAYRSPSKYGYIWPFYGPITSLYGEQRPGYVHTAIDIGALGRWGAPVLAIAAGRVISVEHQETGLGNHVVIAHDDGSRSLYAHLADTWVQPGQTVQQGAHLGPIGCTGLSTGTHLHFELWRNGKPVDPLPFLSEPVAISQEA